MAIVSLAIPEPLAALFSDDPAVVAEAARYLRIAAFSQLFLGAEVVLESAMGGAGWTVAPMVASTVITLLRLPVGAWAAARWGVTGVWVTLAVTAAARGLLMMGLWAWGRWRRSAV
jgi:Na+-driven multidrug efflux pump